MNQTKRAQKLLDMLWEKYKKECPYADWATEIFPDTTNDHIAFRCIPNIEIGDKGKLYIYSTNFDLIENLWESLGWYRAVSYNIPSKNITAMHMIHSDSRFPKIFISKYNTNKLSKRKQKQIFKIMGKTKLGDNRIESLKGLSVTALFSHLTQPLYPNLISLKNLNKLADIDQYIAWVYLFGFNVNHFTMLVNNCGLEYDQKEFGDWIERNEYGSKIKYTYEKLKGLNIPMKDEIEGEDTGLAQTSTQSSIVQVETLNGFVEWPYTYYELAERGFAMFDGFKIEQTQSLFNMTKK